ncbi:MAG: hypothetical protein JWN30_677 [Bacilli bacterium]|nr:hypothetical protein [Bacilli bacterium]
MSVSTQGQAYELPQQVKRRSKLRQAALTVFTIACVLGYLVASTAALVLYGPYENLRRNVIGSILSSSHPSVINPFFSKSALAKYQPVSIGNMSIGDMSSTTDFSSIQDNGIETVPIKTSKFSGSLLIVHDPKRVHVASTKYLNNVGQTVTDMVKDVGAVAGMNAGGFYDGQGSGTGGVPLGLTISRNQYICGDQDSAQPVIGLTKEGSLIIGIYTYAELQQLGVTDVVSYGPELVHQGKPYLTPTDDTWGVAPRSVIGQRSDGSILLLCLSGRGNQGVGASLLDCEAVMLENGAYEASNLDGGYSSELYYNGQLLVPPSNPLGERYVATSFVVDGVKK